MSKNEILKELMFQYNQIRINNIHKLEMLKKSLYSKVPRLLEIENELKNIAINTAKTVLEDAKDYESTIDKINKQFKKLQDEKETILLDLGLEKDFLDEKYDCMDCKDSGFVNNKKCNCYKQKYLKLVYDNSNLSINDESFENFNIAYYSDKFDEKYKMSARENAEIVLKKAIHFVENFDNKFQNILFTGHTGLGKTFLSNAIAKNLINQGKLVLYLTAFELGKIIEKSQFAKKDYEDENYEDPIDDFLEADLLIIDDLGTEFSNIINKSYLFNIINIRLMLKKPCIISTNLKLKELKDIYSDRLLSRIQGNYAILNLFGEDIRILKKYNIIKSR